MIIQQEIDLKIERVRELMQRLELDAVLFRRQASFAWLTCGGRNMVGIATEIGAASILVTADRRYVLCNAVEQTRIAAEERVEDMGYEIRSWPWNHDEEAALARSLGGKAVGCDVPFADFRPIGGDVAPLRWAMTRWEVERYREVGFMVSRAIEDTAFSVRPGDKECAVVGRLASNLWANGLDFITVFVAADDRISRFRHPLTTDRRIANRAMLSVNGRKWGLIVSLTRFVNFGPVDEEIRRRYDATVRIDCAMMAATIPGRPASEAFSAGVAAYREAGFEAEIKKHHQGGAIGYEGRDYKAHNGTDFLVRENQAFTWNPSITGTKSEDTMLATKDGPELLSRPVTYPAMELEVGGKAFRRPDILTM